MAIKNPTTTPHFGKSCDELRGGIGMDAEVVPREAKFAKDCPLKQRMMQKLLTERIRLA